MNRLLRFFDARHLPAGPMREVSMSVGVLAEGLDAVLPESAEKTAGMRKLLEAKDCFVRAAMPGVDDV